MKKFQRNLACVMAVLTLFSLMTACGVKKEPSATTEPTTAPAAPLSGCTVTVKTEGGMALEGVDVYVYADAAMTEMLSLCKTDKDGKAAVTMDVPAGGVAVLKKVPAGYACEASYPITQVDTQIVLKAQMPEKITEETKLVPGSIMPNFTVTDTDGKTHTLSEMLKTNKAVMLNLWYVNCGPCKAEFPYLQQAYEQYGEGVALLGLNCFPEDDEAAVKQFKADNDINFPMAKIDSVWEKIFEDSMAYPTTIVIDRFGMVSLIHVGGVDSVGVFAGVFQHYSADDYVQSIQTSIYDLGIEVTVKGEGTEESPLEFYGSTEFEVTVKPGATIYCDLFKLSGMNLTVQSETVAILYNGKTYQSANGAATCFLEASLDKNTPIRVAFTNKGAAEETYKVTLEYPIGTRENPHALSLGDFAVTVPAGDDQGIFYTRSVAQSGTFVLTVKSAPGAEYSIALNNLTTETYLALCDDGEVDADGNQTLSVKVTRKDEVQIIVSMDMDSQGQRPVGEFLLNAAEVEKQIVVPTPTPDPDPDPTPEPEPDDSEKYNGTLANPEEPVETYGFNDFSVEVGAGQKMLVSIIRSVGKATLGICDLDAYVVYKDVLYKPDADGNIYIPMESEGSFNPLSLEIGNCGDAAKTIEVTYYFEKGTFQNPGVLQLGSNTINCAANNDQGTYYIFEASADGVLTLVIDNVDPSNVVVGISISDQQGIPKTVELESGATSVSLELPAGAEALIVFSTKDPDKEWKVPAATVTITATFA